MSSIEETVESILEHHGIKGMRWGIRRERDSSGGRSGSRGTSRAKRSLRAVGRATDTTIFALSKDSMEVKMKIVDDANKSFQKSLPSIKSKHGDYAKLSNRVKHPFSPEAKAYRKDVQDTYLKHLEAAANSQKNAQGTYHYTLKSYGQPNTSKYFWDVDIERVKHADDGPVQVRPIFDDEGYIVDIEIVDDQMTQTAMAVEEFLEHHGIKGMKWGVRRDNSPAAVQRRSAERMNKQDRRFRRKSRGNTADPRYTFMSKINYQVDKAAQKSMKPDIKALNKKPEYRTREARVQIRKNKGAYHPDPNTYPIAAKYHTDVSEIYLSNIRKVAPKYMKVSPSGRLEHQLSMGKTYWQVQVTEVKHADNGDLSYKIRPVYDDEGYIISFEMIDDNMSHSAVEDILEHHGTKGMKWGVRKDRSSYVTVADKRKRVKTSGGHGRPAHPDAIRARTIQQVSRKSGLKALSNEELTAFNQRLNLEQQARRLNYNDKSPPKKFVLSLLGRTGSTQAHDAANQVATKQVKRVLTRAAIA